MMEPRDPTIRPWLAYTENGQLLRIKAVGGLRHTRRNRAPYFTLTGEIQRRLKNNRWDDDACGCLHNEILKHWPELADLVRLHLSYIDGVPMHHEANGWFFLAGYYGGANERHHAGNSKRNCLDGCREPNASECLQSFADHCRITYTEAEALAERLRVADDWASTRIKWVFAVEQMRPRFKAEADACIARHNLQVYGDPWTSRQ